MPELRLLAGVAKVDITPDRFCDLSGFLLRDNPSTGIHDRIFTRALAFDDGRGQALLIVTDILGLTPVDDLAARTAIAQATGVPAGRIMLASTHTHAAPASMPLIHCGEVDPAWIALLRQRQISAAVTALHNLAPARLSSGRVATPPVNANRREWNGVVDRDLDILRIDGERGPIAAVMVYGCHPVAAGHANRQVSADYFGVLVDAVERATGAVTLATSGACGDVNPAIDGDPFVARPLDLSLMNHVGATLADVALAAWPNLTPVGDPVVDVSSIPLELPYLALPTHDELSILSEGWRSGRQTPTDPSWAEREAAAMLEWVARTESRLLSGTMRPAVACEVRTLRLGDIALVGVPGELFAALGLVIKASPRWRHPIVLGYANGNVGYIPTRDAYVRGGYEVSSAFRFYDHPAALAPEAGEMIIDALR